MNAPTPITPQTKVADLLEAYPQLEEVLVEMAPAFANLRNPVLRRTIARVATLERAAAVAGLPVRDVVVRLREAAGLDADDAPAADDARDAADGPAEWVVAARVVWTVDADRMLETGEQPIAEVQRRAAALSGDELGLVRSAFRPAPLVDLLRSRGFRVAVVESDGAFATFVGRDADRVS
jgi:hypothetical protein